MQDAEREPLLGGSGGSHARAPDVSAAHTSSPAIADIDERLRRWKATIADRFSRKAKAKGKEKESLHPEPVALISVFQKVQVSGEGYRKPSVGQRTSNGVGHVGTSASAARAAQADGTGMPAHVQEQVEQVRQAIEQGLLPQMIQTGSSGSYFARRIVDGAGQHETVAVFKPRDEEPYGNANPKRVFVRKYLWWMMGRSCLVPNFSASSEAGASYLDSRLNLNVVPGTYLVSLSSPSFFYPHADREAWRKHQKRPPEKVGSFQLFLRGYVNASTFLRRHPWPSRPAHLLEADLAAEQAAHKLSRKKPKAYLRKCLIAIKRFLLCRTAPLPVDGLEAETQQADLEAGSLEQDGDDFRWTAATMRAFRIELEKLVVLDFLMRNTDRGLDNFMVHTERELGDTDVKVTLGAIDNSLSFPHRHPNGIRDYPFGWLWLPADLIGQPFSPETRNHFLPLLSDPSWWIETVAGLQRVFEQDEHFSIKVFDRQMAVMRGQGLNLVESLMNASEGPIELCARPRMMVYEEVVRMTKSELNDAAQSASAPLVYHQEAGPAAAIRPGWQQHRSSADNRDLHTVAERDASDAEEEQSGPQSGAQPVPVPRENADPDVSFDTSVPALSPDAQPRSLPEAEMGTYSSGLARWQQAYQPAPERTLMEALDQSMTGIEVLEREIAAAEGLERERDMPFFKRNRRVGSENAGPGERATTVPPPLLRSPATSPGQLAEGAADTANGSSSGARPGIGLRQRSNTSMSGGAFARFFSSSGLAGSKEAGQDRGRHPRMTRSNSAHVNELGASVLSLPAADSADDGKDGLVNGKQEASVGPMKVGRASKGESNVGNGSSGVPLAMSASMSQLPPRVPDLRPSLRKRMGSVSGWSITSLGAESQDGGGGGGGGGAGGGATNGSLATPNALPSRPTGSSDEQQRKVKVIIQRAVHDPSRPFLRWY